MDETGDATPPGDELARPRARREARELLERIAHSHILSAKPVRPGWVEANLDEVTERLLSATDDPADDD